MAEQSCCSTTWILEIRANGVAHTRKIYVPDNLIEMDLLTLETSLLATIKSPTDLELWLTARTEGGCGEPIPIIIMDAFMIVEKLRQF